MCVQAVLFAFVDMLPLAGLNIVDAMRLWLQGFRLPGEAQIIDRMVEKFAEHYFSENPDLFSHADVAYTLAFSIIMLNTDAHSSMLKDSDRVSPCTSIVICI